MFYNNVSKQVLLKTLTIFNPSGVASCSVFLHADQRRPAQTYINILLSHNYIEVRAGPREELFVGMGGNV